MFMLYHSVWCDPHPIINLINDEDIYDLDLQMVQKKEHNTDLSWKTYIKCNPADPKQSLMNIKEYFESLQGSSEAPCS